MKTVKQQIVVMAAIVAVLLLLAGCGGGGEDGEDAPANQPPSANAGPDQTVDAGSTVTLAGSGSDADGSIAGYQWEQTSGPTVSIVDANEASAFFAAPAEVAATITLMFQLTVTDNDSAIASDDISVTVEPIAIPPAPQMVSLSGTVTDQSTDDVIVGARVIVYQESASAPLGTTTTDATGAYEIQISAEPGRVTVKTESENFAPQATVVDLEEGTRAASADLGNVPVGVSGMFLPTEPIEVMGDGRQVLVSVPANSLVTASGGDPAGMVSAEVTVLDASVDLSMMPGDFMAWNTSTGKLQPIDSFGALDVRFEDDDGESLTLSSGQQARIWIPLAMNKDPATAPATMPLFYWSDEMGYWIQDGTATLDRASGVYVGDVGHFTVWNVDAWVDTIDVSVCVEDSAGNPVIGAWVYAQAAVDADFNGWSAGTTDPPDGSLDLPIAQDLDIVLSVLEDRPSIRPRVALVSHVFRTGSSDMTLLSCLVVPASDAFVLDISRLDDPGSRLQ